MAKIDTSPEVTKDNTVTLTNKTLTSSIISVIKPASDSTTAIQINKADGTTNVLNVDTTNGRVGIGTTTPGVKLDVAGTVNATALSGSFDQSSSGYIKIGNALIQWGVANIVINAVTYGYIDIGFPISFKVGTTPVVTTAWSESSKVAWFANANITGLTNTGFRGHIYEISGTARTGTFPFHWIAIGVWQ